MAWLLELDDFFQQAFKNDCTKVVLKCARVCGLLFVRWCIVFRFEWKVRNQQEYAEQELLLRNGWISEITDLIDWLNAASVKVRAAPAIDSDVDGKTMQLLISEHKVELHFNINSLDFFCRHFRDFLYMCWHS